MNLKKYRELSGMTQEELSERSKVSRTTISKIENDETVVVNKDTMTRLAEALNKTVQTIFFNKHVQHAIQNETKKET